MPSLLDVPGALRGNTGRFANTENPERFANTEDSKESRLSVSAPLR